MSEKKANDESVLQRVPRDLAVLLVFGNDRGLVAERARRFADATGLPLDDAFTVVRLDAQTVESEPGRLFDEVASVSMFAPERLVWVRGAGNGKALGEAVKAVGAKPFGGVRLLVEAGELKKGAGLRGIVAAAPHAVGLPCYHDSGAALDRLIDDELAAAGIGIALDARAVLRGALGGDRLASRGELQKLTLYAHGEDRIALADVAAAVSDAAALSLDEGIDAAFAGRPVEVDRFLGRVTAQGGGGYAVLGAALRHLHLLALLRQRVDDGGASATAAIEGYRPTIFFARQKDVVTALRLWDMAMIAAALDRIQNAILETRRTPALEGPLVRHAMLALTQTSQRSAAGR